MAPSICKSIRLIAVMDLSLMLKSSEPKISNLIMQIDSASTTTKKKRRKPNWKYVVGIYLSIAGLEQNQKTIIFMISIKHDGKRDNR